MNLFDTRGKIAVSVLLLGFSIAGVILATSFFATGPFRRMQTVMAQSTATTTVTILNIPPNWTVNPFTNPASNTSTPTNAGSNVTWYGVGTSPNGNRVYLLLCMTSSTPTPNIAAAPVCGGGLGNQWGVSASTTSGTTSTVIYLTTATSSQINPWFAWICDGDINTPRCNSTYQQGTGLSGSPFVVNHRPNFSSFTNNSPAIPGAAVTWTALASDTDNFTGSTDTVQLFVCKAADFTGTACGVGGTYCSSTPSVVNPACSSTISIPTQDSGYSSYGYVMDQHQFAASGAPQGGNATETVSAVAPTITSSSINLLNVGGSSTPLTLTNPGGQTTGFQVTYTVSDNNSCVTTSSAPEVTDGKYRRIPYWSRPLELFVVGEL